MRAIFGLITLILGIGLSLWLSLRVFLYGGIMSAINNWGINNSAVTWGIIQAIFFEVGFIPGWIIVAFGWYLISES